MHRQYLVLIAILILLGIMTFLKKNDNVSTNDWENPLVFNINRVGPRAHFHYYESEKYAQINDPNKSKNLTFKLFGFIFHIYHQETSLK